ncbi:helix-turn-helix transcriptional regulator [Propionibacteriaceae bacterium Y2011]
MPRRTTDYRGLTDSSRVRVLATVQEHPGVTLSQLASQTGLHTNTVWDHLKVLVAEGLVASASKPTGARGRPPKVYYPVDDPERNAVALDRVERARRNGDLLRRLYPTSTASTGARELSPEAVQQLDMVYEHLDDTGLDPVVDEANLAATLVPCPYHRIVAEDQQLACSVHARLLQDILAQVPGPLELDELQPFVTPRTCLVRLRDTRGTDAD